MTSAFIVFMSALLFWLMPEESADINISSEKQPAHIESSHRNPDIKNDIISGEKVISFKKNESDIHHFGISEPTSVIKSKESINSDT